MHAYYDACMHVAHRPDCTIVSRKLVLTSAMVESIFMMLQLAWKTTEMRYNVIDLTTHVYIRTYIICIPEWTTQKQLLTRLKYVECQ